jgi:hypothetical protein
VRLDPAFLKVLDDPSRQTRGSFQLRPDHAGGQPVGPQTQGEGRYRLPIVGRLVPKCNRILAKKFGERKGNRPLRQAVNCRLEKGPAAMPGAAVPGKEWTRLGWL